MAEKDKKKTLSISTGFKKKYSFDASAVDKKKTYSIPKKKTFGNNKFLSRNKTNQGQTVNNIFKKICRAAGHKSFYKKR